MRSGVADNFSFVFNLLYILVTLINLFTTLVDGKGFDESIQKARYVDLADDKSEKQFALRSCKGSPGSSRSQTEDLRSPVVKVLAYGNETYSPQSQNLQTIHPQRRSSLHRLEWTCVRPYF